MNDWVRTKRKLFLLQGLVIAVLLLLNEFLYDTIQCSNEYLQSRDVWGTSQAVRRTDLRMQQKILDSLPADREQGLAYLENKIRMPEESDETGRNKAPGEEKAGGVLSGDGTEEGMPQEGVQETEADLLQPEPGTVEVEENPDNYVAVYELVKAAASYGEYISCVEQNVQSMAQTALYHEGWLLSNIAKCQRDYYGLGLLEITPVLDYGINACVNYRITDILAVTMAILFGLLMCAFYRQQNSGMYAGESWIAVKSTAFLLVGVTGLYGINLFMTMGNIGGCDLSVSIQSLTSYYSCPYFLKLYEFLGICLLMKLSVCLLFFLLVIGIWSCNGRKRYLLIAVGMGFLLLEFLFSRYSGISPWPVALREINVFSAVTPERFFNRYLNLNIGGKAVSRLAVFLVIWVLLLMIAALWSIRSQRRFCMLVKQEMQAAYYDEINQRYQETRQMWHDFQNHLLAIQMLNEGGDYEGADRYVRELKEQIDRNLLPVKTGSNPVDMLLFKKSRRAAQLHAVCHYSVNCSLADSGIMEFDLCSILGNLMDNALEAVADLPEEKRRVELTIKRQNEMICISLQNPYIGERKQEGGRLLTTKADAARHGIGLSSIRRISKKYQGFVDVRIEEEQFSVSVLLNTGR